MISFQYLVEQCFWLHKRTGKKCFLLAASIVGDNTDDEFYWHDGWNRRMYKSRSTPFSCYYFFFFSDYCAQFLFIWCSFIRRFQNFVIECKDVEWFEIHQKISTSILSPNTTYAIYLVFHSSIYIDLYFDEPVKVSIGIDGVESIKQFVCLNPHKMVSEGDNYLQYPQQRKDDRFEVKLGEYFNRGGEEMNLEISMTEESENPKNGPGIEGFELRPKTI